MSAPKMEQFIDRDYIEALFDILTSEVYNLEGGAADSIAKGATKLNDSENFSSGGRHGIEMVGDMSMLLDDAGADAIGLGGIVVPHPVDMTGDFTLSMRLRVERVERCNASALGQGQSLWKWAAILDASCRS